jgi:hypothetical protein
MVAVGAAVVACCRAAYAFLATVTADGQSIKYAYVGSGLLDPDRGCFQEGASALAVQVDAKIVVGGAVCGYGSWISRFGEDLRLDEGSPLQLRRVQPRGNAPLRGVRTMGHVRLTTTVGTNAPASVIVSVRRATHVGSAPGTVDRVASGRPVTLLPGSSAGRTILKRSSKRVESKTANGRVALRLLLPSGSFPRGSWGVATVRAVDTRGRTTALEMEFRTR